ncbi:hypothetical protein SASPL_119218 [Salvia splendens]|uniref:Polyadenylate-binding protein-interacting protein 7 n=1 Tax=Salvia splendens TaxID=180675 RepID=A0A8X8XNM0_SALSN|nr:hypothetical protein SASPL_119218 [Salvia splendens]
MYLSGKGPSSGDKNLGSSKLTLNPNATEFVPYFLRSPVAGSNGAEASSKFVTSAAPGPGKGILDRVESSASNDSDDEAQQYWCNQLPDDITPDFKVMGIDDNQGANSLSFSSLSLTNANESSRFSSSIGSGFMLKEQQGLSLRSVNGNNHAEQLRYPVSSYGKYLSPTSYHSSLSKPWDQQIVGNDQLVLREGTDVGNPRHGLVADMSSEQLMLDNSDVSPLEFLASHFPGFAAESLTEVYFANGGDLNLTIEMLTQLELQVDGGLNQTMTSKTVSAPNLNSMDFPALSVIDGQTELVILQNGSAYYSPEKQGSLLFRSNSFVPSRGATDFASAVRKMVPQDSSMWKYEKNGSSDASIGQSRNSQVLASSYNSGQGRGIYGDRFQSRGSARSSPVWLETGDAVGNDHRKSNMYSEMRGEARDHARVRNVYFEQNYATIIFVYVRTRGAMNGRKEGSASTSSLGRVASGVASPMAPFEERNVEHRVNVGRGGKLQAISRCADASLDPKWSEKNVRPSFCCGSLGCHPVLRPLEMVTQQLQRVITRAKRVNDGLGSNFSRYPRGVGRNYNPPFVEKSAVHQLVMCRSPIILMPNSVVPGLQEDELKADASCVDLNGPQSGGLASMVASDGWRGRGP